MIDIIQKTRDDYNKIARHFAETRNFPWPEFEQFKPFIRDGQRVLDWGCGNGRLLGFLKEYEVKYCGLDQSQGLLKIAKQKFAKEIKSGKAKFFCTAYKEKNFTAEYFDIAFMVASFFHLPDKKTRLKLLKKTKMELKDNGYLLMTVWNLGSEWARKKSKKDWKKIGDHDFLIPWKNQRGETEVERYYHHFTKEELKGLLEETGFKIESMEYSKPNYTDGKEGRNLIVIAKKVLSL